MSLQDLSPERRITIVQNMGNVETEVKELTQDGLADIFLDISPGKAAKSTHFKSYIKALRRGGRASLMGAHHELLLPTQTIMVYDLTVKGRWLYTKEDMRTMIKLVETGYLKLGVAAGIKTVGIFALEQFAAAFDAAANMSEPCTQVVVSPHS